MPRTLWSRDGDPLLMPHRDHITWPLAHDVSGADDSGLHNALCQCNSMAVTAFCDATGNHLYVDRQAPAGGSLTVELQKYLALLTYLGITA